MPAYIEYDVRWDDDSTRWVVECKAITGSPPQSSRRIIYHFAEVEPARQARDRLQLRADKLVAILATDDSELSIQKMFDRLLDRIDRIIAAIERFGQTKH